MTSPTAYRVAPIRVCLSSGHPSLREAARAAFQQFGLEQDGAPAPGAPIEIRVVVEPAAGAEPAHAGVTFQNNLTLWRQAGVYRLGGSDGYFSFDPSHGRARCAVAPALLHEPDRLRSTLHGLLIHGLVYLLQGQGLQNIHAAALDRDGIGVLLVAPSDHGKSTLAYSLVQAGWRYLSDDAVLARLVGDEAEVWPFRRNFTLDAEAEDYFPGLKTSGWDLIHGDEQKRYVPMRAAHPDGAASRTTPRLLVFPRIADADASRTEPATRVEAFGELLKQTAFALLDPEHRDAYTRILRQLVVQCSAFHLHAGRDVLGSPQRVAELFDEMLAAAPSTP